MKRLMLLMAAPMLLASGCADHPTTTTSGAASAPTSAAPAAGTGGAGPAGGTGGAGDAPTSPATATPTRTSAPPGRNPTPAGTPRCHTKDLGVSVGDGEGAAGTQYIALLLTNRSGHTCTLYGYPGVSWVTGDDGRQVNDAFTRSIGEKVTVKLAPGRVAHATIAIHNVGFFDPATCKPVDVRGFRVYPPDETTSIFVSAPDRTCSAKGVNVGRVLPIAAGTRP